jgi:DNA-binding LytR/AlgR family response regulator
MWWFLIIADSQKTQHELQALFNQMKPLKNVIQLRSETPLSALSLLDSLPQANFPECIFIDIDQGSIPGISVINRIRARELPIPMVALMPVFLAASNPALFTSVVNQALNDYQCLVLHHPIARVSLQHVINKLARRR